MKKIILVLAFCVWLFKLASTGVSGMAVYESKPAQLILNQFRRKQEVTPEMQNQLKSV
jgi:hypothetical protein